MPTPAPLQIDFVATGGSKRRSASSASTIESKDLLTFVPNGHTVRRLVHQPAPESLVVLYDSAHEAFVRERFFHQDQQSPRAVSNAELSPSESWWHGSCVMQSARSRGRRNGGDHILGVALGVYLFLQRVRFVDVLTGVFTEWLSEEVVRANIAWLMGWPAGLKLNGQLDRFVRAMALQIVDNSRKRRQD